ncbi:hypothetical protein [Rhizobium herbae]|uniref:Uncharacterized protein n=1 Tax=Rhizobium herbae TaxID=508661 RepID=A0ABS4EPA8_9HYPH|nr:hypothetical protein [Rhizobium herbae]MBP1859777.1 hypothetical protein [Rhizobium herbae]
MSRRFGQSRNLTPDSLFGKGLTAWFQEWDASEELRFQFPGWGDYAYPRLRAHWDASPNVQRHFDGDRWAFLTAAKADASASLTVAMKKSDIDAREAMEQSRADVKRGGIGQYARNLFGRD